MPLATQSRLGPYEVMSLLGAGAMGEVYRARDTRLQRSVAIKILPAANGNPRGRFEQEARAASALNHPNIVTIHDVGHEEDLSYIVTELVEGESLRHALQKQGRLPMRQVLDIGIQIADGVAAAHDHGIVHRDLKPENIMITRDGRVKILDFGLAKPTGDEPYSDSGNTLGSNDTEQGLLVGTTAYMSPEQARGLRVGGYADQFAVGVILYEMASGTQPFRRESPLHTLSAILTEDAPPLAEGSPPFQWLVKRCMHKDPDHRYASTHDLARELRNIRDHLTGSVEIQPERIEAPIAPPPAVERRWLRPTLSMIAVTLAATAGYLAGSWFGGPGVSRWQESRFTPFSTDAALEAFPAWSPNGRSLAYSLEVNDRLQIAVRGSGATMPVQLTQSESDCFFPFWSPDGARVYFISEQSLWSVGATGGTPEKVLDNAVKGAISPDGNTLAVLRAQQQGSYSLWMGPLRDLRLTRYTKGRFEKLRALPRSYLRFSPDGTKLGAWLSLDTGGSEFWSIPLPTGEPTRELRNVESFPPAREFAWVPGANQIVYSDSHLWRADLKTERSVQITNGTGRELSPSVSASGRELAFSAASVDYDIVRVTLDGRMENLISSPMSELWPARSSHGQFAYATDRSGSPEILVRESSGSWERPLVAASSFGEDATYLLSDVAFSPDGKRIAYRRSGSKREEIWVSTITDGPPVKLAKEPGGSFQRFPSWSPDGNSIVYSSVRDGVPVIVRTRVGAIEQPIVIARDVGTAPTWSPKGNWIATLGSEKGVTLVSPDGASRKDAGSGSWLVHGWSANGSHLYGIRRSASRKLEVVSVRPEDGSETVLADIGVYPAGYSYASATGLVPMRGFALSEDGRSFLTSVIRPKSDLWIMEKGR